MAVGSFLDHWFHISKFSFEGTEGSYILANVCIKSQINFMNNFFQDCFLAINLIKCMHILPYVFPCEPIKKKTGGIQYKTHCYWRTGHKEIRFLANTQTRSKAIRLATVVLCIR